MKKVAVIQSSYIPWKGYFDIMRDVDLFVVGTHFKYTRCDWRNRNRIKTPQGTLWLTVPVGHQAEKMIREVVISGAEWASRHWRNIEQYYGRAPYFRRYRDFFRDVYLGRRWENLSELNFHLITRIAHDFLGIRTGIIDSAGVNVVGTKLDGLLDLLRKVGADLYVSGPRAKAYIDEQRFHDEGIGLVYKDYAGYPEYPQFFPPFIHEVSIVDMLFHLGPATADYIWGWRRPV